MKVKKGKAIVLTVAAAAFIASIVYDKKINKDKEEEIEEEKETSFIVE